MTSALLPFLAFAIVASATPGPNNILVLATSASHGLRAAIPLILGVALGFGFMVALIGAGLAGSLADHARLQAGLRWLGAGWLLVLAWKIARADIPAIGEREHRPPLGFWTVCAYQWINPKAWIMALATAATYTVPGQPLVPQVLLLAALFVLVSLPCVSGWALLGSGVGRLLDHPARVRTFNVVMGLLLAASAVPPLLE